LLFGSHYFTQNFLQAKVNQPILGIDFLSKNSLAIDCNKGRVVFPSFDSRFSFPVHSATPPAPSLSSPSPTPSLTSPTPPPVASFSPDIAQLLFCFPSVTTLISSRWPTPSHSTRHHIHTTGLPISSRAHRLSPEQLLEAEKLSVSWKVWASLTVQTPHGHRPCIWFPNQMEVDCHVETTAA
jgi:hypothetical protein